MAAAAGTTKSILLIFTLLSLICFTSSLLDKAHLAKLRETHQKLKEQVERLKAEDMPLLALATEGLDLYLNYIDSMKELMTENQDSADDFFPMDSLLKKTKTILDKTRAYTERKTEEFNVKLQDTEVKLGQLEKMIHLLEKLHDEL